MTRRNGSWAERPELMRTQSEEESTTSTGWEVFDVRSGQVIRRTRTELGARIVTRFVKGTDYARPN